jgi:hypothetical protein
LQQNLIVLVSIVQLDENVKELVLARMYIASCPYEVIQ